MAIQVGRLELFQTFRQIEQKHSVFRVLIMIDPIGQHTCISFFLYFTSLNPLFVIVFLLRYYYYYYAT